MHLGGQAAGSARAARLGFIGQPLCRILADLHCQTARGCSHTLHLITEARQRFAERRQRSARALRSSCLRASLAMAVPAAAEVHDSATDAQQQPEAERPPTDQQPEQAPPGDEQRLDKVIRRSLERNAVAQQLYRD